MGKNEWKEEKAKKKRKKKKKSKTLAMGVRVCAHVYDGWIVFAAAAAAATEI